MTNIISWFYVVLGLTTILILSSVFTGKMGKRRAHLVSVVLMTGFLLGTIYLALEIGKRFEFPPERYRIHMPIARIAFVTLFGPLITGPLYWFGKVRRKTHLFPVVIFVFTAVSALVTGAWMLAGAVPKANWISLETEQLEQ